VRRFRQTAPVDFEKVLPRGGLTRWSARQKAAVVLAVRSGTLSLIEVYDRYMLSEEELSQWEEAFDRDGIAGLQAKNIGRRVSSSQKPRRRR
jgi:hypothetical protein